ncbi:MAG: hypothetical protein HYR96_03005 [Deltaproteobacteria bacterium]|nr:hypothetical protein [Deltaproteobacteria bacterium]
MLVLALTLLGALVAYARMPAYLSHPNFYAEDGTFTLLALSHPLAMLRFRQNGWYTLGSSILYDLATLLNQALFHGRLTQLSVSVALVSYLFWGFIAAFPLWLFSRRAPLRWGLLLWLTTVLFPMPWAPAMFLGSLCNAKFAFGYLAALICFYGLLHSPTDRRQIPVALGTVFCALSCPYAYLFAFALIIRLGVRRISLLILLSSVPQALALREALRPMPGITEGLPTLSALAENLTARLFGFPFLYPIYSSLNLWLAVLFSVLITSFILWASPATLRKPVATLLAILCAEVLLFAYQRPQYVNVAQNFAWVGYNTQYFLPLNLTIFAIFTFVLFQHTRPAVRLGLVPITIITLSILLIFLLQDGLPNRATWFDATPTLERALSDACEARTPDQTSVLFRALPEPRRRVRVPTNLACLSK